ncbi:MAG TPA: DUF6365 family protein [Candidatus Acidoferrales bacterium]|nr:DUF6365 family protein [Candidatus Acidoferrales bacterium]
MTTERKHLILALGQMGFGETILGLRLGAELRSRGDQVFVLAHDSNRKLLENWGSGYSTFCTAASPLLQLYISNCLEKFDASSIILSDYITSTLFFDRYGLDPAMLRSFGRPVVAIDTWDTARVGHHMIDMLFEEERIRSLWPEIVRPICPVPILSAGDNARYYVSLPSPTSVPKSVRKHMHHALGIDESCKAVLFCTAEWQHPGYQSNLDAARKCADALPLLLAAYLSRLGEKVHLVHVGPKELDFKGALDGRYHWLPPLRPQEFDTLVASMDLFLTANISATTIAKAMVSGVPVFVLQNSVKASTREEAETALSKPLSESLQQWLEAALPLFPFALWPLGYYKLVKPLLEKNPYVAAIDVAEMMDEARVETKLRALLFDAAAREEQLHRQAEYIARIKQLPSGPEVVHSVIEAESLVTA